MGKLINGVFFRGTSFRHFFAGWMEENGYTCKNKAYSPFAELVLQEGGNIASKADEGSATIKSWVYKECIRTSMENGKALEKIFNGNLQIIFEEEEKEMSTDVKNSGERRYSESEKMLMIDLVEQLLEFMSYVEEACLDLDVEEIEISYDRLHKKISQRTFFLSEEVGKLFEECMESLSALTIMDTYDAEYSEEIGEFYERGFRVKNIPLMIKTHEEILVPYNEQVDKLRCEIKRMISR